MSQLYEVLGVEPSAPPEQIRSAYRKRALRCHPDRLPPCSSDSDKKAAEEEFRKVSAAYEVLTDPENRRLYDKHGVWPPPEPPVEEAPPSRRRRHESFHPRSHHMPPFDPFAGLFDHMHSQAFGGFPRYARPYHFRDPFELFNTLFEDLHADPFFHHPVSRDPFRHQSVIAPFPSLFLPPALSSPYAADPFTAGPASRTMRSATYHSSSSRDGSWVSESRMTRTINGVTESVWKRKDASGNEHVTYTYPDGTQRHTLNGVDQVGGQPAGQQRIPPPPPLGQQYLPPPQPYSAAAPPYPPYPGNHTYAQSQPGAENRDAAGQPSSSKRRWRPW